VKYFILILLVILLVAISVGGHYPIWELYEGYGYDDDGDGIIEWHTHPRDPVYTAYIKVKWVSQDGKTVFYTWENVGIDIIAVKAIQELKEENNDLKFENKQIKQVICEELGRMCG